MPENKIIPVTLPGYTYSVAPMDIGSKYAEGITSAGQSIAGAIRGVMGGIDKEGNVQQGILEQNSTVNDMISNLGSMKGPDGSPMLSQDTIDRVLKQPLGARHQFLGLLTSQFANNLQTQNQAYIENIRNRAAMERTQVQESGATQRQVIQTGADPNKQTVSFKQPTPEEIQAEIDRKQKAAAAARGPSDFYPGSPAL